MQDVGRNGFVLGALNLVTATNSGYVFPGATSYVSGVAITNATGVVTATSTVPNAAGSIVLTPTAVAVQRTVDLKCTSPDISPKYSRQLAADIREVGEFEKSRHNAETFRLGAGKCRTGFALR
ncbi:MAG: hypothetical protein U1F23_06790 [Lysobacterales bacterium]